METSENFITTFHHLAIFLASEDADFQETFSHVPTREQLIEIIASLAHEIVAEGHKDPRLT